MDQEKIGKFIAERRRKKGLTQFELAEKLNITDRAVSKWETGKTMPDSGLMLDLCLILDINVNDLLHGEVVEMNDYKEKTEELLVEMTKQKELSDKRLLAIEWIVGILSVIVLIVPILIAGYFEMKDWQRIVLCFSGVIPAFIGIFSAIRIEQLAGYYKCANCGHTHVPTFKQVTFSMHMGRTRYIKCPNCGKKTWQKKVISKN